MTNKLRSFQSDIQEIHKKEFYLISKDYHKSNQLNPKCLKPKEYIITYFSGTEDFPDGPAGGTLTWLEP